MKPTRAHIFLEAGIKAGEATRLKLNREDGSVPLVLHSNGFWELCQVHYGSDIPLEVLAAVTLFELMWRVWVK